MPNRSKIYEVKCPSCGAPLQMSGMRVVCDYCGSVLERERPPAEEPATFRESQVVVIQTGHTVVSDYRASSGASCLSRLLISLLFVGLVGVVSWVQFPGQTAAFLNGVGLSSVSDLAQLPQQLANKVSVTALTRIIVLPGENQASPDFLTFAYPTGGSTYHLTYVESPGSTVRWQGPALKEAYNTRVLQSPEALYFTDETTLYALNRETGQTLWQSSLADKLSPGCPDCFELIAGRLVALVQGGAVQGFDAGSGQLVWSHRLQSEPAGRLLRAGDRLLIFDRSQDSRHNLALVVDPVTGEKRDPIILPACSGDFVSIGAAFLYNESREELYFLPNGPLGPPCLQIWELAGQTMAREILFEGLSIPLDAATLIFKQPRLILAGDSLYLAANQTIDGVEAGVVAGVNLADGGWRVVAHALDYRLTPLAAVDNLLIVRATRSRGTARSELWGIDLATGEPRWQHILQAPRWFKEPGAGAIWDWRLAPQGLAILQVQEDPDQLLLDILDPQTGVSSGQKIIPVSDSFFTDLTWTDDAAWVALRQIHKVDLATGTLSYVWP